MSMVVIQLREFGWTQEQIAKTLNRPQKTISNWLRKYGYSTSGEVAKAIPFSQNNMNGLATSITLFPCRYEEAAQHIEPGSIGLILTDPPYLASSTDIIRSNQANLQRDFGDWDNIPQAEYTASVSIWANLIAEHLNEDGSLSLSQPAFT